MGAQKRLIQNIRGSAILVVCSTFALGCLGGHGIDRSSSWHFSFFFRLRRFPGWGPHVDLLNRGPPRSNTVHLCRICRHTPTIPLPPAEISFNAKSIPDSRRGELEVGGTERRVNLPTSFNLRHMCAWIRIYRYIPHSKPDAEKGFMVDPMNNTMA